ncbi:hypothetical protein LEP1GSC172_0598 [Leptospira noguchii]|uniref:Uncharacterized protein n=1 Tax=Leptospira noguchii TaxID=28182 RepID=M6VRJ4_9LEPT|nr:hypothetical protein LEP1GSC172_0598 [Leptospira noguchii]
MRILNSSNIIKFSYEFPQFRNRSVKFRFQFFQKNKLWIPTPKLSCLNQ